MPVIQPIHLSLDPGNLQSGWVRFQINPVEPGGVWVQEFGITGNEQLRGMMRDWASSQLGCLCVETMKARGMPTSNEEIQTCIEVGRFLQVWPGQSWSYVFRGEVKLAVCGALQAKDSNIRQALIDLWGGQDRAIGGKRCPRCHGKCWTGRNHDPCTCQGGWLHPPGPLHGMTEHCWPALGVAFTWAQAQRNVHELPSSNKETQHESVST